MTARASALPLNAPPIPRSRLIGRETERETARSLLLEEAVPLLTLTGPGGVGKTRLALAIAHDVADHFADGVVWVDFAPLADPALVGAAVATALNVTPAASHSLVADLARHLHARQTLLLLDNCEHVLVPTADIVARLLVRCPALQVLVTSRAPLRVRDEQLLPIEPLPVPATDAVPFTEMAEHAAVRLFAARARASLPGFRLDADNAPTVSALCRALDGLPLAIELAAARMTMLSPQTLLSQMSHRLQWLSDGPRDLPARQQTIMDTIAWSYDLLAPEVQHVFRRLAVFAGGFSLEAAEWVSGSQGVRVSGPITPLPHHPITLSPDTLPPRHPDTLDLVSTLVEQSLVQRREGDGELRFTLLETVREYALTKLVEFGEEPQARDAHAAWFLRLSEEAQMALRGQAQHTWLQRLDDDRDNLRGALDWLLQRQPSELAARMGVGLISYWLQRGAFAEGSRALRAARERGGLPSALFARTMSCEADLTHYAGDYTATEELARELLAHGHREQDGNSEALGHSFMSKVHSAQGTHPAAVAHAEQALAYFRLQPDHIWLPISINRLGLELSELGDYARAQALFEEAIAIWHERADSTGLLMTFANYGALLWRMGEADRALAAYQQSLRLAWEDQDPAGCAEPLAGIAALAADRGESALAAGLLGATDALCAQTGFVLYSWSRQAAAHAATGARARLPEDEFRAAREHGKQLDPALVVAAVLSGDSSALPHALPPAEQAQPAAVIVDVDLTRREREDPRAALRAPHQPGNRRAAFPQHPHRGIARAQHPEQARRREPARGRRYRRPAGTDLTVAAPESQTTVAKTQ